MEQQIPAQDACIGQVRIQISRITRTIKIGHETTAPPRAADLCNCRFLVSPFLFFYFFPLSVRCPMRDQSMIPLNHRVEPTQQPGRKTRKRIKTPPINRESATKSLPLRRRATTHRRTREKPGRRTERERERERERRRETHIERAVRQKQNS